MTTDYPAYAKNHLLRLAQPLFWTLDELGPELESVARMDALQTEVRHRLATFKSACYAAALRADAVEAIHYCFCAAMDQAGSRIHGRAGSCRGMWLQRSLLKEYYKENGSGKRCRAWLAQLQQDPKSQADALTVIGHLIARGLRDELGAPLPNAHLPEACLRAEETLVREPSTLADQRGANSDTLVQRPDWRKRAGWLVALIGVALICAVGYVLYRQHFSHQVLVERVAQLTARVSSEQVSVDQRIARLLAPDIASGVTNLGKRGDRVYLLFSSDMGFAAGKAKILPQLARQLDQLATVLARTDDLVTVIGHTDASVGQRGSYASNLALSRTRAMAVGRYLQERGAGHGRISIIGRGSADPVGDNRTEAGRALNRRIEIVIDRPTEAAP